MTTADEFLPAIGPPSSDGKTSGRFLPTPTQAMNAGYTRDPKQRKGGLRRGHEGNELLRRVHAGASISSAGASPASPCPTLDSGAAMLMLDGYGRRCVEFARCSGPDGSWLKTCLGSSQLLTDGSSEEWSETWPRSGTISGGIACRRAPLVPRISGTGFSSSPVSQGHQAPFPTPSATSYGSSGNGEGNNTVSRGRPSLDAMARRGLWPTPTVGDSQSAGSRNTPTSKAHPGVSLTDAVRGDAGTGRRFPTPNAVDSKAENCDRRAARVKRERKRRAKGAPSQLPAEVADGTGGQLNPTWVCWLMGFPPDWLDIGD